MSRVDTETPITLIAPQPSELTELSPNIFPKKSIGQSLWPNTLTGRRRPSTTFNQPFRPFDFSGENYIDCRTDERDKIQQELSRRQLTTISDILTLSEEEFNYFTSARQLRGGLSLYLASLTVTPHARLLEKAFGQPQVAVPIEREAELVSAVEEQLTNLTDDHLHFSSPDQAHQAQQVLILMYGLQDGVQRSLAGAYGRDYIWDEERRKAHEILDRGLTSFLYSHGKLEGYLTLPPSSIGSQVFEAVFRKDLPDYSQEIKGKKLKDLPLSTDVWQELKKSCGDYCIAQRNLTSVVPLSEQRSLHLREYAEDHFATESLPASIIEPLAYPLSEMARQELSEILPKFTRESSREARLQKLQGALKVWPAQGMSRDAWYAWECQCLDGDIPPAEREIELLRTISNHLAEEGLSSGDDLQRWLMDNTEEVFGFSPNCLVVKAMIEYIFNHPTPQK